MLPTIALDMDGTIADCYGVNGWLDKLQARDASPYFDAGAIGDADYLNALIELYKAAGGHVCVVSWTAKGDIPHSYYTATQAAKMLWLRDNLPAIDDVRIVEWGTPKYLVVKDVRNTVLFDDEQQNRDAFRAAGGMVRHPKSLTRFLVARLRRAC